MKRRIETINRDRSRRSAFTLLEVLLVLAILGVIAGMVVPNLMGSREKANVEATKLNIKGFEDAVKMYANDHYGKYPEGDADTVVQLLLSNVDKDTGEEQKVYLEGVPKDAWDQKLYYEFPPSGDHVTPSGKPAIWSAGLDGQDGTEDDINNWEEDNKDL
jgi:general secretion pathway protein G